MAIVLSTSTVDIELTDTVIAGLRSKFPTKNVDRELLAMNLWLTRYPKRRPVNIWRFVDHWLRKSPNVIRPAPTIMFGWWTSDERTINQGAAIGLTPRPGETMVQFRDRISEKLKMSA